MTTPDSAAIAAALAAVPAAAGRAQPPAVRNGTADVILDVSGLAEPARSGLEQDIRAALGAVPGIAAVRVAMTAERRERKILAIASGKGGVGKSTVAANLAVALARSGVRVGLVDADIYGPSQPRLMAAEGTKPQAEGQQLIPVETRFGVPMLSMGQLVDPGQAIAWRGPMAASALGQLIDARWGEAELLVVDMPPGTGDVQLTMIQKHRPAAALIVSTPQDLALIDATRAMDLFGKAGVPVMGLIENMAGYRCPSCGTISDPFGHGGAEEEARARGIPFLGRVPLSIGIRRASDAGNPPAAGDEAEGAVFADPAAAVRRWLNPMTA